MTSLQAIDDLINDYNRKFPDGISQGIYNSVKYELYEQTIPKIFNAEYAYMSVAMMEFRHIRLDHYTVFIDDEFVYLYSQPYGYYKDAHFDGFELIYNNPTSWYYPDKCSTQIYKAPIVNFALYTHKKSKIPYILPLSQADLTNAEKRLRNLRDYEIDIS